MQIWNEFKQDCNDNKIHIREKNNYGMNNIGINVNIAAREKRIIRYKLQWGVKEFGVVAKDSARGLGLGGSHQWAGGLWNKWK